MRLGWAAIRAAGHAAVLGRHADGQYHGNRSFRNLAFAATDVQSGAGRCLHRDRPFSHQHIVQRDIAARCARRLADRADGLDAGLSCLTLREDPSGECLVAVWICGTNQTPVHRARSARCLESRKRLCHRR